MIRIGLFSFGLVALTAGFSLWAAPALAQQANPAPAKQQANPAPAKQAREIQGKVIRKAPDQFVVQTRDNKEVTVYTHPKTTYRLNNRDAQYSDVRVGVNVTTGYDLDGTRYLANNVVLVPTGPAVGTAVEPAPLAEGTVVQGKVIRVIGQDQVVIQTADGKEVIVYVSPQTTYQVNDQGGAFTDLRPGIAVGIHYDLRDRRFQARRIFRGNR